MRRKDAHSRAIEEAYWDNLLNGPQPPPEPDPIDWDDLKRTAKRVLRPLRVEKELEDVKRRLESADIGRKARARQLQIQLTPREKKIFAVIQGGFKALAYCRELHRTGLRPRTTWIDRGCPGTYPAAYRVPHWRQRINDEKYKIGQKANRARLASE